jgi:hypothetical protein
MMLQRNVVVNGTGDIYTGFRHTEVVLGSYSIHFYLLLEVEVNEPFC